MKNFNYLIVAFVILAFMNSCSKEIVTQAYRAGKYKCLNDYSSICRSCTPQDTHYTYIDTVIFTFKNDSLRIYDIYGLDYLGNDSFVYDRGPFYPGMYWSVKFHPNDSLYIRFYQFTLGYSQDKYSYCRKLK